LFRDIALGIRVPLIQFCSNIVFTLSLPCYELDYQYKKLLANKRKNARLRAKLAAETAEEKLVRREKRNEKRRSEKES